MDKSKPLRFYKHGTYKKETMCIWFILLATNLSPARPRLRLFNERYARFWWLTSTRGSKLAFSLNYIIFDEKIQANCQKKDGKSLFIPTHHNSHTLQLPHTATSINRNSHIYHTLHLQHITTRLPQLSFNTNISIDIYLHSDWIYLTYFLLPLNYR